ncbi:hypothetical protein [Roseibium aggregatum]|uniref:NHLP leader peptide family natural product n=1 Tax=Roseibium aggregatum TaxID=187304 RepID=A0A939EEM3_9HYPH|nr:hypothetical protein [Roseibium aggregatum]MBN9670405.1 hypothetical protein [Roseibium aggregatum]
MHTKTTSQTNLEIGSKLGAIIQDTSSRTELIENPSQVLAEIGVTGDVTLLADTADMVHLVVPADVDVNRAAAGDEAYFEELGRAALGTCFYDDLPE